MRAIILFDGVCNLCNGAVQFVIKRDKLDNFCFAPLQSAIGQQLLRSHELETKEWNSFILIEEDKVYNKSTAALRVAKKIGGPWKLLYGFIIVPKGIRDFVYSFIAKNRYRWFGQKENCMIPTPELRKRFLN